MKNIAFLVSGNGGNLKFFQYLIKMNDLPLKVILVIGDRKCGAIDFATKNIPDSEIFIIENYTNDSLIKILNKFELDYIITNIHRILSYDVINKFEGKLINLHYSLLPAFGGFIGMKSVDEAMNREVGFVGTTVHYVNEELDNGEIISQTVLKLEKNINKSIIYDIIFRSGAMNLWNTIAHNENFNFQKCENLNILSHDVFFNPDLKLLKSFTKKEFWEKIKE